MRAAVGQLDEAIFYMRSRGISPTEAIMLLMLAFVTMWWRISRLRFAHAYTCSLRSDSRGEIISAIRATAVNEFYGGRVGKNVHKCCWARRSWPALRCKHVLIVGAGGCRAYVVPKCCRAGCGTSPAVDTSTP